MRDVEEWTGFLLRKLRSNQFTIKKADVASGDWQWIKSSPEGTSVNRQLVVAVHGDPVRCVGCGEESAMRNPDGSVAVKVHRVDHSLFALCASCSAEYQGELDAVRDRMFGLRPPTVAATS